MDWIRLSPDSLEEALNKNQLEILKAQNFRSKNRDIAQDVIDSVVARVRAEIAASGLNALDEDHSRVPPELKECVLRLAVDALQSRVPSLELSASQIKHADLARELLLRVATGQLPISRPDVSVRTARAKKGIYAGSAKKCATRNSMSGF